MSYPRLMLVGNTVINGNSVGKNPVMIVKFENGRYYAENGYSWKYAIEVK
jgi:hypothetical protein